MIISPKNLYLEETFQPDFLKSQRIIKNASELRKPLNGSGFDLKLSMNLFAHLSINELGPLLQLVQRSHCIRRHYELFNWLQEDIQDYLPHGIVIAAWGDFTDSGFCYDIVSPLPGVRTEEFDEKTVRSFLSSLFWRWQEGAHHPFVLIAQNGFAPKEITNPDTVEALQSMRCALVHGIKDQRGRHNCLYVMMGPEELGAARSKEAFRFLLPYIDTTFRQIIHLPEQYLENGSDSAVPESNVDFRPAVADSGWLSLSAREIEIMDWVRKGKTNSEIGMILDISIFTVKNHLQRIFKKLNVFNRAQAVAKFETPSRQ